MRVHCGILSRAGIRSGQRIVNGSSASRQLWNRHGPLLRRLPQGKNSNSAQASSWESAAGFDDLAQRPI